MEYNRVGSQYLVVFGTSLSLRKMVEEYKSQILNAKQSGNAASSLSVRDSDKSKPYIPPAGVATDGWSQDDEATATCFCGTVQLAFVSIPSFI